MIVKYNPLLKRNILSVKSILLLSTDEQLLINLNHMINFLVKKQEELNLKKIYILINSKKINNLDIDIILNEKINQHSIDLLAIFINNQVLTNIYKYLLKMFKDLKIKAIAVTDDFTLFNYFYNKEIIENIQNVADELKFNEKVFILDTKLPDEINKMIKENEFENIEKMYHFSYSFSGIVSHGKQLGRKIGFPTANIYFDSLLDINEGVFVCKVKIDHISYFGMGCYMGLNQIINKYVYEVNIFNFNKDIYGNLITIYPIKFLRSNIKIKSIEELIELLKQDKINSETFIKEYEKGSW